MSDMAVKYALNGDHWPEERLGDAFEGRLPQPSRSRTPRIIGSEEESGRESQPQEPAFPLPVVASALLQENPEPTKWLWHGFLAEKGVTLFSALWKTGKTTLLAHLVRNMMTGAALCGHEVLPATVLYITEESKQQWRKRIKALGLGDNAHFILRPFKAKPNMTAWRMFIMHVQDQAALLRADLVVFDTLSALWPVHNENDAGEVQAALMPLWNLAAQSALLLTHHLKKGDGQEGTGSRGSGALPSFVDTIMELRRHEANDRHCRKRVITSYGRDEETPAELVIELDPGSNEYISLGDRNDMRRDTIRRTVLQVLPKVRPGMTLDEIKESWPEEAFPRRGLVLEVMAAGAEQGDWIRDGTGAKGHPYRYLLPLGG